MLDLFPIYWSKEAELRHYVVFLGGLPLLPQIILSTHNEMKLFFSAKGTYRGTSLWLRNILLGEALPPKVYKSSALYCQPVAEFLAATFRLATAVHPRTSSLELLKFPHPAALWFHCCWVRSEKSLECSGLTGRATLIGKREYYERRSKLLSSLKSFSFEPDIVPTAAEAPELLLLTEAQRIAIDDYNFYVDHLLPYLRVFQRTEKKIKECKRLQFYYLLPDGTLFITGKHLKLPKDLTTSHNYRELPHANYSKSAKNYVTKSLH